MVYGSNLRVHLVLKEVLPAAAPSAGAPGEDFGLGKRGHARNKVQEPRKGPVPRKALCSLQRARLKWDKGFWG